MAKGLKPRKLPYITMTKTVSNIPIGTLFAPWKKLTNFRITRGGGCPRAKLHQVVDCSTYKWYTYGCFSFVAQPQKRHCWKGGTAKLDWSWVQHISKSCRGIFEAADVIAQRPPSTYRKCTTCLTKTPWKSCNVFHPLCSSINQQEINNFWHVAWWPTKPWKIGGP